MTNGATRKDVLEYVSTQYGTEPEYLWRDAPGFAVLRNSQSRKWYAIIMDVNKSILGLSGDGKTDILDFKCPPYLTEILLKEKGFLPAYHMNKEHWVTLLLDGSLPKEKVFGVIDMSKELTDLKPPRHKKT